MATNKKHSQLNIRLTEKDNDLKDRLIDLHNRFCLNNNINVSFNQFVIKALEDFWQSEAE